jgi:hypothetical protein
MQWSDVLNDKSLSNLPYKIELNELLLTLLVSSFMQ